MSKLSRHNHIYFRSVLILLSPAKTLDFETPAPLETHSDPEFLEDTNTLVEQLRQLSASELSTLMKISDKLGALNASRYQTWQPSSDRDHAKQAIFAFQGDVYQGLDVASFSKEDCEFAQDHLRILSGLYGILRPLDLIQPYRLEMGTKIAKSQKLQALSANTLYDFWTEKPTRAINQQLNQINNQTIVNLASNEYFKVVKSDLLEGKIITPVFKDWKNDKYKIISFYAKKARGMMAAYIIKNRLEKVEDLKNFNESDYIYSDEQSDHNNLVFIRK